MFSAGLSVFPMHLQSKNREEAYLVLRSKLGSLSAHICRSISMVVVYGFMTEGSLILLRERWRFVLGA